MLKSTWVRLGVVLSIVWLLAGGYWSFMRNSYEWRFARRTTEEMCEGLGNYTSCVADLKATYSPPLHWIPLVSEIVGGLVVIWLIVWTARWIVGRSH